MNAIARVNPIRSTHIQKIRSAMRSKRFIAYPNTCVHLSAHADFELRMLCAGLCF